MSDTISVGDIVVIDNFNEDVPFNPGIVDEMRELFRERTPLVVVEVEYAGDCTAYCHPVGQDETSDYAYSYSLSWLKIVKAKRKKPKNARQLKRNSRL